MGEIKKKIKYIGQFQVANEAKNIKQNKMNFNFQDKLVEQKTSFSGIKIII